MNPCQLALRLASLCSILLLVACATPVFKDVSRVIRVSAIDVQQSPEQYNGAQIVWGGRIVGFNNLEDRSEVEVVAFPVDRGQQPITDAPSEGRFLLVLPGYVEALDYEVGRHLTVQGTVFGTFAGRVQEHDYLFPLVRGTAVHVWPWGFMLDRKPRISIGVGVGIR